MRIERGMLDLAYISPVNPTPSGLSDYSEMLLPALSEQARVTLYTDSGTPLNSWIAEQLPVRRLAELTRHHLQHDLRLYQLGNSAQHAAAFDSLRRYPGVVVLHEPFLHTGLRAVSHMRYARELGYEYGVATYELVRRFRSETRYQELTHMPLIARVLDLSAGVIVHSQAALSAIEAVRVHRTELTRDLLTTVIAQPMPLLDEYTQAECRAELGLPDSAFVIGVAGLVVPSKEPEMILRAFAHLHVEQTESYLLFAGELPEWYTQIPDLARALGVHSHVLFAGRLEPIDRLHRAMAACDVIVNLRRPTFGETSATALRALALGRSLIVRECGWYAELPDGVCLKIALDGEVDELVAALRLLAQDAARRAQLSHAAQRYIAMDHDVATVAQNYIEFLWTVYERAADTVEH